MCVLVDEGESESCREGRGGVWWKSLRVVTLRERVRRKNCGEELEGVG